MFWDRKRAADAIAASDAQEPVPAVPRVRWDWQGGGAENKKAAGKTTHGPTGLDETNKLRNSPGVPPVEHPYPNQDIRESTVFAAQAGRGSQALLACLTCLQPSGAGVVAGKLREVPQPRQALEV